MKKTVVKKEIKEKAKELVKQMTLEEKASLCSGLNFWETKSIERLGIPSFMLTDGPHGLRKQDGNSDHLGLNDSVATTCFPPAAATGCSFDRDLVYRMGVAMGEECRAEEVSIILGPGSNIKRSPLCGRNFEYFSEDPLLTGEISAAMINGVQSKNVGTSMKHYLANNQEKARVSSNSLVDERALREIYLPAFEIAVKKSQPWTLMCSYNQINDIYASDNKKFMNDILRDEWDFDGAIVTDWGAMNNRVEGIKAGLDLEMPGPGTLNEQRIINAVKENKLDEKLLDLCATKMTEIALRSGENTKEPYNQEDHNELVREIARESAVLLKHGSNLPLEKNINMAVVGSFAKEPRYQGAGSSKINSYKISSFCDSLDRNKIAYTYSQGFKSEGNPDSSMIKEAVNTVTNSDVAVVMLGLPDSYESEGFDRTHMNLPESQSQLMEELIKTGKPLIVVISTGSAVNLPWRNKVDSILLMYLTGQNGGDAIVDLLFGNANPSGKLSETWPLSVEDIPCDGFYGGKGNIEYRESIYVGYRYYNTVKKPVAYPFGFGLSYTSFEYSNLVLSQAEINENDLLTVTLTVNNTGKLKGKEIVQLYVSAPNSKVFRPIRELREFGKMELEPGESKEISFELDRRAFAYYNTDLSDWAVESGSYIIQAAASSQDIRLEQSIIVNGSDITASSDLNEKLYAYNNPEKTWPVPKEQFELLLGRPVPPERSLRPFTVNSTLNEIEDSFIGRIFAKQVMKGIFKEIGAATDGETELQTILNAMLADMPLRQLGMLSNGALSENVLNGLVEMMNGHFIRGFKEMRS